MISSRLHPGTARRLRTDVRAQLLLLIGTPGTGKRPVGHFLEQQGGFEHLDFENAETRKRYLEPGTDELRARVAALAAEGRGLVITWAAGPVSQLREVRRLQSLGFEPIWFDSDRGAACQAHFAASTRAVAFHFIDSFEQDGTFRPVEAVVVELLEPRPRLRPQPVRDLVAAAGRALPRPRPVPARGFAARLRWRVAGGLALVGGLAAASAALMLGLEGGAGQLAARSAQPARVALTGQVAHAQAAHARVPALPRFGVLVSGQSLGGVHLGDTRAQVRALWGVGQPVARCEGCRPVVWYYSYPTGDPVGAGIQFSGGRVVAVFTLGSPPGWHTEAGIKVGQLIGNQFEDAATSVWKTCIGFSAKSTRTSPDAVTSILTQGAVVDGFALTRPSISPCQ